jgi:peptidoglycan/LPS O-acetylase OafA/YrhL
LFPPGEFIAQGFMAVLGVCLFPVALFFLIWGFVGIRESGWTRPIVAAGDASYSAYLIHPIVFLVASARVSKLSPPIWSEELTRIACFAIILAVSLFSFRYFETPMIRFGNRFGEEAGWCARSRDHVGPTRLIKEPVANLRRPLVSPAVGGASRHRAQGLFAPRDGATLILF